MHICVYCGSRDQVDERYGALADEVGGAIAKQGWSLVYGGGSVGLMGRVARAVQAGGGSVVGVIPASMDTIEVANRDADELIVVETMRERKQIMDDRADAFLVLPGGFGTLEELSEAITHRYLDCHTKPVVILDDAGFYKPLAELFDHFIEHGFASASFRDHYKFVATPGEAMQALSDYSVAS